MIEIKRKAFGCILILLLFMPSAAFSQSKNEKTVFQSAPIIALMNGVMNDNFKVGEISKYGNFGLGTFNGVDGEMIVLHGITYRVNNEGKAVIPGPDVKTPFVTVTFFKTDKTIRSKDTLSYKSLTDFIDANLPSKNLIYAVKVNGEFSYMETRSEPKQTKSYSNLADVLKNQSVFKFQNVKGTMVGFKYPAYMGGVNVPGYHFHFLTIDKKEGGHVLNLTANNVKIEIEYIRKINLNLPASKEFDKADLSGKVKD